MPDPQTDSAQVAPARERLKNRRPHDVRAFEYAGIKYVVGLGRFSDGRLAEVFFNVPGKVGTDLEAHARDMAIAASLCLQHGCDLNVLRRALTRTGNGSPGSALSYILDQVAAENGGPE
jgi:hypothetical protein